MFQMENIKVINVILFWHIRQLNSKLVENFTIYPRKL